MSFDLDLLRRFETVCRRRSFSRAAEELGLSHSAMTKSIRALEEGLNVRLIERTTRALALTEAGQRLLARTPELLAHAQDVKDATLSQTARLSVICGPIALETLGYAALLRFRAQHPSVPVDLQTMTAGLAVEQLAQSRADLLVIHANVARQISSRRGLTVRGVVSEPYVALSRRGHAIAGADMSFEAMLRFEWVVAGFDRVFQEALPADQRDLLHRLGFPKYSISTLSACADLAESSDVLTLAPASAAAVLTETRELAIAPLPVKALFSICAVARSDAIEEPAISAFIDALAGTKASPMGVSPKKSAP